MIYKPKGIEVIIKLLISGFQLFLKFENKKITENNVKIIKLILTVFILKRGNVEINKSPKNGNLFIILIFIISFLKN